MPTDRPTSYQTERKKFSAAPEIRESFNRYTVAYGTATANRGRAHHTSAFSVQGLRVQRDRLIVQRHLVSGLFKRPEAKAENTTQMHGQERKALLSGFIKSWRIVGSPEFAPEVPQREQTDGYKLIAMFIVPK